MSRVLFLVAIASSPSASAQVRNRPGLRPPTAARAPNAGTRRTLVDSGAELMCRTRGAPVARTLPSIDSRAPSLRPTFAQVFVSDDVVAVRGADQRIVVRTLPALRTVATISGAGAILFADTTHLILWRHENIPPSERFAPRRVVSVDYATARETLSAPMPLPDWVLATSEVEHAETVRAALDGNDIVLNWEAAVVWTGGVAPSDEQRAAAHHEDCGSIRIGASGAITQGSYIRPNAARPPPPPSVSPSRTVTPRYAGDGLYWVDTITPLGITSHALADGTRPPVPVTLGAIPDGSFAQIAGLWARGSRVVVLRTFQRSDTYSLPCDLYVIDRATGANAWSTPVAPIEVVPPRP